MATFQWIGIAIVVAVGIWAKPPDVEPAKRLDELPSSRIRRLTVSSKLGSFALVVLLVICLIGNYGAAVNAALRFPGQFQLDSADGRDAPLEAVQLAKWYLSNEGPGTRIVSDRATSIAFETYAFTQENKQFPQWSFFDTSASTSYLHELATSGHIKAIIVDSRLASAGSLPQFGGFPPAALPSITPDELAKLESLPWLHRIHSTQHYVVLKVS